MKTTDHLGGGASWLRQLGIVTSPVTWFMRSATVCERCNWRSYHR